MTSASQKDTDGPHRGSLVTAESLKPLNPSDHHDNSIRQSWVGHLNHSPRGPGSRPLASQQLPGGSSTSLPFLSAPEQRVSRHRDRPGLPPLPSQPGLQPRPKLRAEDGLDTETRNRAAGCRTRDGDAARRGPRSSRQDSSPGEERDPRWSQSPGKKSLKWSSWWDLHLASFLASGNPLYIERQ